MQNPSNLTSNFGVPTQVHRTGLQRNSRKVKKNTAVFGQSKPEKAEVVEKTPSDAFVDQKLERDKG